MPCSSDVTPQALNSPAVGRPAAERWKMESQNVAIIVCPNCGALNKAPHSKLVSGPSPNCGKCHGRLFTGEPTAVASAREFDRFLSQGSLPVLVDVWAPWCGPCRAMAPMFEQAAAVLEPDIRLIKLNSDEAPELSARLGIRSIPTLLLIHKGKVLARASGVMRADQIAAWARSSLARESANQ